MRAPAFVTGLVCLVGLVTTARAEPTDLGGVKLGQKMKKAKSSEVTWQGCSGTLVPTVKKKKVTAVELVIEDSCGQPEDADPDVAAKQISDAITAAMGAPPVTNAQGDQLGEGKKVSMILTSDEGGGVSVPEIWLVPPTTHRTCWSDDGF